MVGRIIHHLPGKQVEISQSSSMGHFMSLYGLSISKIGVSFSILMHYNVCIMRLGVILW